MENIKETKKGDIIDNSNRTKLLNKFLGIHKRLGPFLIFGFYGVVGVFIDLDHFENWLVHAIPISSATLSVRPFHMQVFIIVGFLFLYTCAYMYRYVSLDLEWRKEYGKI